MPIKPLLLKPIPCKTVWGANHVSTQRNTSENIGTWWEVSAHPNGSNEILNLDQNTDLMTLIQENSEDMLGINNTLQNMLRCGYLDTQDALSIQVHPDDDYALAHSNDYGKYESWYIVDAKPGATLVAGTTITDPDIIKKAIEDGTLDQYLKKWPVKKGDYIIIPNKMLHALGKDIWAFEIGTNSDTTYRFYDYQRKDAQGSLRPLHLKESFDVVDFSLQPIFVEADHSSRQIGNTPYFTVDELYLDTETTIQCDDSFVIITNLDQDTIIQWKDEVISLPYLDSIFIPYSAKSVTISNGHVLVSKPRKETL